MRIKAVDKVYLNPLSHSLGDPSGDEGGFRVPVKALAVRSGWLVLSQAAKVHLITFLRRANQAEDGYCPERMKRGSPFIVRALHEETLVSFGPMDTRTTSPRPSSEFRAPFKQFTAESVHIHEQPRQSIKIGTQWRHVMSCHITLKYRTSYTPARHDIKRTGAISIDNISLSFFRTHQNTHEEKDGALPAKDKDIPGE